jgi:hypothetical protein
LLVRSLLGQDPFSRAKVLRTGGTSSDASLSVGGLAGSLPQIFSFFQNLGIPSALSDLTLALSTLLSAGITARKTVLPTKKPKGFKQKGKVLKLKI